MRLKIIEGFCFFCRTPPFLFKCDFSAVGKGPRGNNAIELDDKPLAISGNTNDGTGSKHRMAHPLAGNVRRDASLLAQILCLPDNGLGFLLQPRFQRHGVVHVFLFGVEEESAGIAERAVVACACRIGEE